jgi:hypothetical protein
MFSALLTISRLTPLIFLRRPRFRIVHKLRKREGNKGVVVRAPRQYPVKLFSFRCIR